MNQERNIAIIDQLLSSECESELLEFKENNSDPSMIGKLCSALSNSAAIKKQENAYVLWGIDNSGIIVGTDFNFELSNQDKYHVPKLKLAQKLKPSIDCEFTTVLHPKGRIVMLTIPATTSTPIEFDGVAYVRIGSANEKLSKHTNKFTTLIKNLQSHSWESEIAKSFLESDEVLKLLDYAGYCRLIKQRLPENNNDNILESLEVDRLISKDVGNKWNILNLGAILFANDLRDFDVSIQSKGVRFISYNGNNKTSPVIDRTDGYKGYAIGMVGLIRYINKQLSSVEHIGKVFREKKNMLPEKAIRELIVNALIHQDMTITGTRVQIELFSDRMEIINAGRPLIDVDRMIDLPPRSRNETMAHLMRRMGFCEEQGSGLDIVIASIEKEHLPAPKFNANEDSMQVVLYAYRSFADMTPDERVRACYQHSVIKYLSGSKLKNADL